MGHGAWGMGHGAWEASGGPLPLLGGLKTNISAELSFLKSKLSPTFTRGAPPPPFENPRSAPVHYFRKFTLCLFIGYISE